MTTHRSLPPGLTPDVIQAELQHQAQQLKRARKVAALALAKQTIASSMRSATAEAAQAGVNIRVSNFHVYEPRKDGGSNWPSKLAEMLHRDRALCSLSNAKLGAMVANELHLDRPITASAMTNPMHKGQIKKVTAYLVRLGIIGTFKNATDLKNLMKAGPRKAKVAVQVSGDVSTDGKRLTVGADSYPVADRKNPSKRAGQSALWNKLVRILDHDTPLPVVLKLLGVLDKYGKEQDAAGVAQAEAQASAKAAAAREAASADALDLDADIRA